MIDTRIIEVLNNVYMTMQEFNYDPYGQLLGYLMSGDSSYITSKNNARLQIQAFERNEIIEFMLEIFLEVQPLDIYAGRSYTAAKNLLYVQQAMISAGYDPINQIVGFLVTGDASYVTVKNYARAKISEHTVREYCDVLIRSYIDFRRSMY